MYVWLSALVLATGPRTEAWLESRPAENGQLRVHGVQLVRAPGAAKGEVWTMRFRISGRGPGALAFPGVTLKDVRPAPSTTDLEALLRATAPRLAVRAPWDPCTFGVGDFGRHYTPTADILWAYGPRAWSTEWPSIGTASRALGRPRAETVDGVTYAELPVTPRARPGWTAPVRLLRRDAAALDLQGLAALAPPGRRVLVELWVLGALKNPVGAPLPNHLALPEVVYEEPKDVFAGALRSRTRDGTVVLAHAGMVDVPAFGGAVHARRFAFEVGRGRAALEMSTPSPRDLELVWLIHRPWRGPLDCPARAEYLLAVVKHQAASHRVYAALTGRPLDVVIGQSVDRGYVIEPFGQVPALADDASWPAVRVRKAW